MTDHPEVRNEVNTTRRDALLEVVAKYEFLKQMKEREDEAEGIRCRAQTQFNKAVSKAVGICGNENHYGTMIRGTMVIEVIPTGITIHDAEILE